MSAVRRVPRPRSLDATITGTERPSAGVRAWTWATYPWTDQNAASANTTARPASIRAPGDHFRIASTSPVSPRRTAPARVGEGGTARTLRQSGRHRYELDHTRGRNIP